MKELFKNISKSFIIGMFFVLGIIGGTYIYTKAFSTLSTASTGQSLTSQMWNDVIDRVSNIWYNSGTNNTEFNGGIKIGSSSTCNTSNKGATRYSTTASRLEYCDGTGWNFLPGRPTDLGADATSPGLSCKDIYTNRPASVDGIYRIKPDTNNAIQVRCDMTNGGRTLVNIIKNTSEHLNPGTVGSITDPSQTSYWKIADSYINSISKSLGYKFKCGTTTVNFSTSCTFGANTAANGNCLTSPGVYASPRSGLSSYDQGSAGAGKIMYGYIGYPTYSCRDGGNNGAWYNTGRLRVK